MHTLWQRWIEKRAEICRRLNDEDCGAPFVSVAPPHYDPQRIPSILYVGKATRGWWGDQEVQGGPLLQPDKFTPANLEHYVAAWLEKEIWSGGWRRPGPFWYFAGSLSETLANTSNTTVGRLENLVWTNICKIGVSEGNPSGQCLRLQKELAVETLKCEIEHYRPGLIVFVTGDYASDVIDQVVDPHSWKKDFEGDGYWWRPARGHEPPMLWTYHPQGKSRSVRDKWLKKAQELAS